LALLLDQNLSRRLVARLADMYPGATQAAFLGMEAADDREIWAFVREQGYALVTKDEDFAEMSRRLGHPPKVIWLRMGNCATAQVEQVLREHHTKITCFLQTQAESLLSL
jgi:predicted nuclease of predicted toxin-antitoxin system